jgi:CubicO group peptidase (beta-lactamase class C family)
MRIALRTAFAATALYAGIASAMTDAQLQQALEHRLHGDRTGACVAAAVIEGNHVARARVCADPAQAGRIGPHSAFEIGSVSKTMTAALLAELIEQGKASLDDPLAAWLPPGTEVPDYHGQPILLRHVVTHTSGLPALPDRMHPANMADPYADLDEATLLASLGDVRLAQAPGTHFLYSNFAMMVLSDALARRSGKDLGQLLQERLFAPLGMHGAYVDRPPAGVEPASGHLPNGHVAPPWTFHTNLAGFGGVHATLGDMVAYVRGELGQLHTPVDAALKLTRQPVPTASGLPMAINWMLVGKGAHPLVVHEGGTGGFSSFVGFDPAHQRGVVLLSDTALLATGGLGAGLGMHLLDPSVPLGSPRLRAVAPDPLLDTLAGDYVLSGGMKMTLRHRASGLTVQVAGQPEFAMDYDSAGDFYPRDFDALLQPQRKAGGRYGFVWMQGGGALQATRAGAAKTASTAPVLTPGQLQAYVGDYPLQPSFVLSVTRQDGRLYVQATGQPRLALDAVDTDVFTVQGLPAQLEFERKDGKVTAVVLIQNGLHQRAARR